MTIDEALLLLNDRLGQEVTAWVEVKRDAPLLIATGVLENWSSETLSPEMTEIALPYDLRGHYSIADARFDLSDAQVDAVAGRADGLEFTIAGGIRLVVTWPPTPPPAP